MATGTTFGTSEQFNLHLSVQQRLALSALHVAAMALRAVPGVELSRAGGGGSSVGDVVSHGVSASLAGLQCPFGQPPADIVGGFDGQGDIYLHCLHGARHCWSFDGKHIACP